MAQLILVTGATGAVGPLIVEVLHAAGYSIRTLSIAPPVDGTWPDDVEAFIGDVTDMSTVQTAMEGVHAVIHLAALLHIANPPDQLRTLYQRINVGGTKTVVEAAVKANVSRILFFSTISVYGDSAGQIINEETPPQPATFYGQTKLEAERIVLAAKNADGKPIGTVLRLAAVYGSRIKGNYRQLLLALKRRLFLPVGNGENRRTLIYDKDVAEAALLVLRHPKAGPLYNVSDGRYYLMKDIVSAMCLALRRTPPRFSLPAAPVRFVVGLINTITKKILGHNLPITQATIDKYLEDIAVDSQLIRKELGFMPKFDLKSGWRDTVQEMHRQENGKL